MTEEKRSKNSSKDRGWAWMVCAAIALYNAVITGTLVSFGILFLKFSDLLDDDSARVGLVGTTFTLCSAVIGPIAGRLEDELSHKGLRLLAMILCLMTVFGFAAAAWCQQLYQVILTFGLLSGLSIAALDPALLSFIGIYFEEQRSLACGITFAGCCVGGLFVPPLLTLADNISGPRGSLMMLAGVWLHVLITVAICRPLNHEAEGEAVEKQNDIERSVAESKHMEDVNVSKLTFISSGQIYSNNTVADNYQISSPDNTTGNPLQLHDIKECQIVKGTESEVAEKGNWNADSPWKVLRDYITYLCRPSFLTLLIVFVFSGFSWYGSYFLLPLLVDEQGMREIFASQIIMIASVAELISRPLFGLISNRLGEKKVYLLHISFIMTAGFGLFLLLRTNSLSFIIYAVVLGVFGGLFMQFAIPMLMELSEESNVSRVAGITTFLFSSGPTIGQPVFIWLHDLCGTHKIGLILVIACYCLTALVITAWSTQNHRLSKRKLTYEVSGITNASFADSS